MDERQVEQHRSKILRIIGEAIPRPTTKEEQQAVVDALCAHAGCMFAAMHHIPYDSAGRPSAMANAAYEGLERWKEQFDMRQ